MHIVSVAFFLLIPGVDEGLVVSAREFHFLLFNERKLVLRLVHVGIYLGHTKSFEIVGSAISQLLLTRF